MADKVLVAPKEEFKTGSYQTVFAANTNIAVFNLGDEFFAIEDVCTHDGGQLTGGEIEGDEVICPRHGARFCVKDGEALTPPAFEDVETFDTEIEDGNVYVVIE